MKTGKIIKRALAVAMDYARKIAAAETEGDEYKIGRAHV